MAWESRGGRGRYYTRSVRRNGRVVREYVGSGSVGEAAAVADRETGAARDAAREAARAALNRLAQADAHVTALCDAAGTAARAHLLIAGYHRHDRGSWRRRRV
jgi:hypothetical protein